MKHAQLPIESMDALQEWLLELQIPNEKVGFSANHALSAQTAQQCLSWSFHTFCSKLKLSPCQASVESSDKTSFLQQALVWFIVTCKLHLFNTSNIIEKFHQRIANCRTSTKISGTAWHWNVLGHWRQNL